MTYAGDLTPQQAYDLLQHDENAVLIDVRTDGEWREIGIPDLPGRTAFVPWVPRFGAPPDPDFVGEVGRAGVQHGQSVLTLCRSGVRSVAAANALTDAGYGPVYNILQGFEGDPGPDGQRGHTGWRAAGLPWRQG